MADSAYYREEADKCRRLAAASPDSEATERWRSLAADYAQLAHELDRQRPSQQPPLQHMPMQQLQQPMQQQQAKAEPEAQPKDKT